MALMLIVEDEMLLRQTLGMDLSATGHTVHCAENLAAASTCLECHSPDVLLLDISLPDGNGLDFYEANLVRLEGTVVIIMTAVGGVEEAIRAMKLGATDFLIKPVDFDDLGQLISRSLARRSDRFEALAARQRREHELSMDVVAQSAGLREVLTIAVDVARSNIATVLIQGETGTGKNVVARYIHAHSPRRQRPLLEVSCAAIPESLLESELFGHERGAFTDAKSRKRGTLELADGGTLVLDEVGEIKLEVQSKLLHFLEERRFRRVGGVQEIHVDVRILALTNRNLNERVRSSSFRSDLYYRLNVFPITVPPLRERPEDILPLAHHFLSEILAKSGLCFEGFTREAENALIGYSWPGNVRELRSSIERSTVLERGPRITPQSLVLNLAEAAVAEGSTEAALPREGLASLSEVEREMVERALRAAGNNQTRAAELLSITRAQLRYRLKKYGL